MTEQAGVPEDILMVVAEALWSSPANKRAVKWSDVTGEWRDKWIDDAMRVFQAITSAGWMLGQKTCPIGISDPMLCSAGYCLSCLAARAHGEKDQSR